MGQWALHTCLSRRRKAVHDTPEAQHLSVVLVALGEVISRETMTSWKRGSYATLIAFDMKFVSSKVQLPGLIFNLHT